jgi:hypothetical protein
MCAQQNNFIHAYMHTAYMYSTFVVRIRIARLQIGPDLHPTLQRPGRRPSVYRTRVRRSKGASRKGRLILIHARAMTSMAWISWENNGPCPVLGRNAAGPPTSRPFLTLFFTPFLTPSLAPSIPHQFPGGGAPRQVGRKKNRTGHLAHTLLSSILRSWA